MGGMMSDKDINFIKYLLEASSEFTYTRTYSRFREDIGRRETWEETVNRYINFIKEERGEKIPSKVLKKMKHYILSMGVMPSMRALWAAGPAARADNTTMYNCSFQVIDSPQSFAECLYILMCMPKGTIVDTEQGPLEIEKIQEGSRVWSYNETTGKKELKTVTKTHKVQIKSDEQVIIKTLTGKIPCSNKHAVAVYENGKIIYKTANQLSLGDILIKSNHWEDDETLIFNDEAWFSGAFLGDGCSDIIPTTGSRRIRIYGDNESVIKNFSEILSNLSGEPVGYQLSTNKNYQVPVWGMEKQLKPTNKLVEKFIELVGDLPQKKTMCIKVPEWILSTTDKNIFLSFLAGLVDTDGDVRKKEPKITIATSSKFLVEDLKKCFPKFSIPFYIKECKPEDYKSSGYTPTSSMYKVTFSIASVRGFENLLKHNLKSQLVSKQNNYRKWWSKKRIIVPSDLLEKELEYVNEKCLWHFNRDVNKNNYAGEGYWKKRIPRDLYKFDKVVDIQFGADFNEEFHDLTVEDNHNYFAGINNYFLVHNCGTGYGFSVQKIYVNSESLPIVPTLTSQGSGIHKISDDKAGWADSIKLLLNSLFLGKDIDFDYSPIRNKGDKLKTMGGRASGPEPLVKLHNFIRDTFAKAQGRKLTSLECHDICNEVAEIVVVGGVRRSSEMSLSDLFDIDMQNAKVAPFPPRRYMSNNSAVYETKPNAVDFLKEWSSLASSGSGERGIFNLGAARLSAPSRRYAIKILGTNPCGEILLRSKQFCNLSEVVIRPEDDLDDLLEKVECATWIGAIQSTFTYFPYLSKEWKENCEEERLLGVSLTGQMDNPSLLTESALKTLKARAIKIAKKASDILGINMPAAITCVKPSGTVSQLVNCASGIHVRYSPFYIRRYRISATDPLFKLIKSQGVPLSPENGQEHLPEDQVTTWVLGFVESSPKGAITRHDVSALDQLEHYKKIQKNWCEHNASCTIYVKDNEWFLVGNWVYENWDFVGGLSFLPYDGGIYKQAPYEEITEKQYKELKSKQIEIDYSKLSDFEKEDNTEGGATFSCVGDKCELK